MKTWKIAATLTMSITMIIAGSAAAQAGHRHGDRYYANKRHDTGYHYRTDRYPRAKDYSRRGVVVRDRHWRQPFDRGRFVYRRPSVSISFTSPLQFVRPSTNYLYIYGVDFR